MIKQYIAPITRTKKQKQLLLKVTLMMYLHQSKLKLYYTHKNLYEKVQAGLLILSQIIILLFQSTIPWLVAVISNYQKN